MDCVLVLMAQLPFVVRVFYIYKQNYLGSKLEFFQNLNFLALNKAAGPGLVVTAFV